METLWNLSPVSLQIKQIYAQFIFPVQFKYLKQRILQRLENGADIGLIRGALLNTFSCFTGKLRVLLKLFILSLTPVGGLTHRIMTVCLLAGLLSSPSFLLPLPLLSLPSLPSPSLLLGFLPTNIYVPGTF